MIVTLAPLALSVLLAAKTVAVVDLSSPKSPAVAEALRKLPALKATAMTQKATNAAVSDAESLNLICTVDDSPCLEKLMVLIRADELVAFSAGSTSVAVVHVTGSGKARRANVKAAFSPAGTAQAAWAGLEGADPSGAGPTTTGPTGTGPTGPTGTGPTGTGPTGTGPTGTGPTSTTTGGPKIDPVTGKPIIVGAEAPVVDEGVSPAVAVAIAGGAVSVACGAATLGLYADLARQANAAKDGSTPLPDSFYAASDITVALAGCTVVALGAAVVGSILVVTGP